MTDIMTSPFLDKDTAASFHLVPATTANEMFLWQLFKEGRDAEMQGAGIQPLPEPLLRLQFLARERMLLDSYPHAERLIVQWQDEPRAPRIPIGCLIVDRSAAARIRIVDICILPAFRGRGIGTILLTDLLAQTQDKSITLSVAFDNIGAQRLYTRLGFRPETPSPRGKDEPMPSVYHEMIWQP